MSLSVFNKDNKSHLEAETPLHFGERLGIHDTINVRHQYIEDLFQYLKSIDWNEKEVDLTRDKQQFESCPTTIRDIMIKNLAYQSELDSVASRSAGVLIAPFITNSELWRCLVRIADNECLTDTAEVLTEVGWCKLKDCKIGDKVFSYDTVTKTLKLAPVSDVICKNYSGKLYTFYDESSHIYQEVTEKHRMLSQSFYTDKITFVEAKDALYHGGNKFIVSGKVESDSEVHLSFEDRFKIAFQADGSWDTRYDGSRTGYKRVRFGLRKERKIENLYYICNALGWRVSKMDTKTVGRTTIYEVFVPSHIYFDKDFSWVLFDKNANWYRDFLQEVYKWDGYSPRKWNYRKFINTNKAAIDKVMICAHLAGFCSHLATTPATENRKEAYQLTVTEKTTRAGNTIKTDTTDYNGEVYCITVPTGAFLMRQNGCISVTGNCLHSSTYTQIIRMCLQEPQEFFDEVYKNQAVLDRASKVIEVFDEIAKQSAEYTLTGVVTEKMKEAVVKYWVAMYCLERLEFMVSFSATFALAEQDYFLGIATLVQKIMIDEFSVHKNLDKYVIKIVKSELKETFDNLKPEILQIVEDVRKSEYNWAEYLFSEGRSVVGLNEQLSKKFVDFCSQDLYDDLGFELPFERIEETPLPYMNKWLNIDGIQIANQETQNSNYMLNSWFDDTNEDFDFSVN